MSRHETAAAEIVASLPANVAEIKEVLATMAQSVPNRLTSADAKRIGGSKKAFIADLRAVYARYMTSGFTDAALAEWQAFYREVFEINLDTSTFDLPEIREGFDWLVVVPSGMFIEKALAKCAERFEVWKFNDKDLDSVVILNDRYPRDRGYIVRARNRIEADDEHRHHSARDMEECSFSGVTLLERLLLELWHYWKTGKHLDLHSSTICSGSRVWDNTVPMVGYSDRGRLAIGAVGVGYSANVHRPREVLVSSYKD